jgi:hypothetical protein
VAQGRQALSFIEGCIQQGLPPASWRWIPDFHTTILFEDVFDDKLFSQVIKGKRASQG